MIFAEILDSTGDAEAGRPIRSQRSAVTREPLGLPQRQDPSNPDWFVE